MGLFVDVCVWKVKKKIFFSLMFSDTELQKKGVLVVLVRLPLTPSIVIVD